MSLEQVKDIIRKTWRNADDDGSETAESLYASENKIQTGWTALKMDVKVTVRSPSGSAGVFMARTIFARRHGVKLECPYFAGQAEWQPLKLHQTVWIEVPETGKAAGAEVIWTSQRLNSEGNYEFAVELESVSLFELSETPRDDHDGRGPQDSAVGQMPPEKAQFKKDSGAAERESEPVVADEGPSVRHPSVEIAVVSESNGNGNGNGNGVHHAAEYVRASSRDVAPLAAANGTDASVPRGRQNGASAAPPGETEPTDSEAEVSSLAADPPPRTDRLVEAFTEVFESAMKQQQKAASLRLEREIKEGVAKAQAHALILMRKELSHHVTELEEELLQQSRARTEQALVHITKTALQSLSSELDSLTAKTETRIQEMFKSLGDQLDARSSGALKDVTRAIDQQIERSATAIQAVLVRKVLTEVSQKQKDMTEQMERQIGMAADQNLVRLRGGLLRALQELTNGDGAR